MPQARTVWTGSDDGTLRVWDTRTGTQRHEIIVGDGIRAALHVHGTVWCGVGKTIQLYDAVTFEHKATLGGHEGWVNCFALVGDQVWSGSGDHTLRVWNAHSGEPIQRISDFRGWIYSIATADDVLWASCSDRKIRIYGVNPARPAVAAAAAVAAEAGDEFEDGALGARRDASIQTDAEPGTIHWLDANPDEGASSQEMAADGDAAAAAQHAHALEEELTNKNRQLSAMQGTLAETRAALALRERHQAGVSAIEERARFLERDNTTLVQELAALRLDLRHATREAEAAAATLADVEADLATARAESAQSHAHVASANAAAAALAEAEAAAAEALTQAEAAQADAAAARAAVEAARALAAAAAASSLARMA